MTFKELKKLADIQSQFKRHCEFCGHTLTFYNFEPDKKICSWCGRYNYKNEKVKFREKMLKKVREKK